LSQHHCLRCKTPVVIPEGQPGALCPNCRTAVMLEDIRRQPQPRRGSPALHITLAVAILAMVGVWLYVGPLAPEPGINLTGESRATSVTPRRFVLWELHADDTVRVVELYTKANAAGSQALVCNQVLNSRDDVLSLKTIGGRLSDKGVYEEEYRGKTYERPWYMLDVTRDQYGYDARIDRPPHLHINGDKRLISIGVDPKTSHLDKV
jgi:DNA-directed RNA polymerase subunit RPC12/RpoP